MRVRAITGLLVALGSSSVALAAPALTVQSASTATGLGLDGRGSTSTHVVKIADLVLSTEAAGGLTVSIGSGQLIKPNGSTPISYQVVLVDSAAGAPSAAAFTTPSGTPYTFSTHVPGTVEQALYIRYTPAALQGPGAYAASVNLAVIDN
jgi:hypothetical protein